ncbi:MAG: hypothetical protein J6I84_03895 [Bacilli bacterium]|nr:hypothetical protein [Bacilli bacterium]
MGKTYGIDFDNTICVDEWPYIGPEIDGAISTLKGIRERGDRLILITQRTTEYPIYCPELREYLKETGRAGKPGTVDLLTPVIEFCKERGLEFDAIGENPWWELETQDPGRKIYADYYIDDHNLGIKTRPVKNRFGEVCMVVDWDWIATLL